MAGQVEKNLKITFFIIFFIAWGFLVGFSKAVILFTGKTGEGSQTFLECTYFNGFVLKTVDVRDMKFIPDDAESCPGFIDNKDLQGWTP